MGGISICYEETEKFYQFSTNPDVHHTRAKQVKKGAEQVKEVVS